MDRQVRYYFIRAGVSNWPGEMTDLTDFRRGEINEEKKEKKNYIPSVAQSSFSFHIFPRVEFSLLFDIQRIGTRHTL